MTFRIETERERRLSLASRSRPRTRRPARSWRTCRRRRTHHLVNCGDGLFDYRSFYWRSFDWRSFNLDSFDWRSFDWLECGFLEIDDLGGFVELFLFGFIVAVQALGDLRLLIVDR